MKELRKIIREEIEELSEQPRLGLKWRRKEGNKKGEREVGERNKRLGGGPGSRLMKKSKIKEQEDPRAPSPRKSSIEMVMMYIDDVLNREDVRHYIDHNDAKEASERFRGVLESIARNSPNGLLADPGYPRRERGIGDISDREDLENWKRREG